MGTQRDQSEDALQLAERKIERLEHIVRIQRIGIGVCVGLVVVVLGFIALGHRKQYARAILVDDQICCLVATQREAEAVRKQIVAAAKGGLPGEAFIEGKWEDAPVPIDERPVLSVNEAVEALKGKVEVLVEAAAINVSGVNVAALASEDLAKKALDTLKSEYIGDDVSKVISQTIEPQANICTVAEPPEDISTDIRSVVQQLTRARREPKEYVVSAGDFPEKIAKAHGMSVKELYRGNPGLKGRTIHPGEKLQVGVAVPAIKVVTVFEVTREETVEAPVKKQYSPALKRGEQQVAAEGKAGRRKATYRITKHNETQVAKEVLNEETLEKAEPKRLLIGTGDET